MGATFATFERLKNKGVSAFKTGEYAVAKTYLVEAAEVLVELAESAKTEELRSQHEEYAAELIDLAKECDRRKGQKGHARTVARERADDEGPDASEWIVSERPDIGYDDVAGMEDVKQEIRLKMIYPFTHPELARRYGVGTGGGVLLYGPPGTGKTMMAKATAHELDATFFVISPAQIMSKWVGEAEQNVRKLFEAAKSQDKSVIFIDEVEALVPRRRSEGSTVMQRVVPQILQELEGFDRAADRALLFIGATNKPWMLDEAMLRPGRLDTKVYIPLPDAPGRLKLLEMYLASRPVADDVDFGRLCDLLDGYSGADIKGIASQAATRPFLESVTGGEPRAITMSDVLEVLEATPPSVRASDLVRYEKFAGSGE
ncbi:MAG: ATP-binding protein [Phycisphaerae bacterium]|nr:ATP-binding protein [Phycisphaerae bacterium]